MSLIFQVTMSSLRPRIMPSRPSTMSHSSKSLHKCFRNESKTKSNTISTKYRHTHLTNGFITDILTLYYESKSRSKLILMLTA